MMPRYISRLVLNPPIGENLIEAEIEYTDGTSETQRVDRDGAERLQRVAKADADAIDQELRRRVTQPPVLEPGTVVPGVLREHQGEAPYTNSSEEFGSQEHSVVMDAILGRGNY